MTVRTVEKVLKLGWLKAQCALSSHITRAHWMGADANVNLRTWQHLMEEIVKTRFDEVTLPIYGLRILTKRDKIADHTCKKTGSLMQFDTATILETGREPDYFSMFMANARKASFQGISLFSRRLRVMGCVDSVEDFGWPFPDEPQGVQPSTGLQDGCS
ncbi:hypothetical protein Cflav_PD4497 [Pedosphaera parvula Ellin514]|uniref:Uncharacterized protein n=1 Tax=Pedosphaera parvula (strain Ellin514) TaxID=320771 RepID=B9XDU3_PEDPL|nr:hypothetical protein Cflav_PD4497 [Pedosphaera parvula Ellin514]